MDNIKDEFISTLSHEIRTPLTSIKGFSQTLLSSWDKFSDDKKKEFIKIILNQSQRLINLTENVLNVAKIDSNVSDLVLVKVDLEAMIKTCINMVSINYKDFKFNVKKNANLFWLCDKDKTQQILLNILDNSLKYSNNSNTIDINISNSQEYNVVTIVNYGSYIKKRDIDKIFDKFYRASSYKTSTTQGSGLGLYIAQNLAKKMNGYIDVKSDKEKTSFSLYLPIYEVERITKNIGI